ncbi:MAG TPA: DUF1684 domain-containing protein [Terriglobales bacterium]|jgi:uncharacterized protein|nr:DUF1684 domain-containing protein [Terriglobales bacterium]
MKQSHRWIPGIVLSLGMVVMVAAGPKDASWQSELQSWRVERAKNLQAPEGWLSLIGLNWLNEGDNSFGAVEGNLFQISAKVPAHIAVLRLQKGTLRLLPPAEGFPKELKLDGKPASEATLFADDAQNPSKLTIGTVAIIIIHRDERYALRVKDTQAPSRSTFHGLSWYAPDEHYRIHAKWIPYTPPKILDIPTILGTVSKLPAPGVAEFTIEGRTVRLEPVLESPDSKELFFILRDTTSKTTTYGGGRFLYTELPDHGVAQPGDVVLDFNRLINPPCAFTAFATCPLPPMQNRLPVAISAGEKRYHE